MDNNDYYYSSDLSLVAALSLFYPIEYINKNNPRKAEFAFRHHEKLEKLITLYYRKELTIYPQDFFNQLRVIKARLYGKE